MNRNAAAGRCPTAFGLWISVALGNLYLWVACVLTQFAGESPTQGSRWAAIMLVCLLCYGGLGHTLHVGRILLNRDDPATLGLHEWVRRAVTLAMAAWLHAATANTVPHATADVFIQLIGCGLLWIAAAGAAATAIDRYRSPRMLRKRRNLP